MKVDTKQILDVGIVFGLLVILTVLFGFVSGSSKLIGVMSAYAALAGIIYFAKLTTAELGLQKRALKKGTKLGGLIAAAIFSVLGIVYVVQPEIFRDGRYTMNTAGLAWYLLIVMPFMTVILEELLFRGVTLGLLQRKLSAGWAVGFTSVAFGLWHVFSAKGVILPNIGQHFIVPTFLVTIGVILVTGLAGVVLAFVRLKSKSLLAPILVHWAINASAVFFAFLAFQK